MAYTPVELRHVSLKKGTFGYRKEAVDQLLADVASSFEDVWRERADLADRVEALEHELERHRERETLLSNTLLAAERAATDAKEDAARKAEQLVAEAHAEARQITRSAIAERERLLGEVRRVKSLLRSALDVVDEGERAQQPAEQPAAPEERRGAWPGRVDDTREFEAPRPSLYLSAERKDASSA
jgi:cell division septum initiation protein DivIVA